MNYDKGILTYTIERQKCALPLPPEGYAYLLLC